MRYLYKGKCRAMETVDAGTISKGGKSVHVTFRRTVHGPVYGYAKARGTNKQVALSTRRSSYGRETVDQLFFQQMTYGRVHSANDFIRAAYKTPQTFNSFYASTNESAFFTSGLLPLRPKGVNPDLPVNGEGKYEWKGYLANRRTRRSSTRRPATSSTGTTSRPRTSRPPTAAGTSSRCSARSCSPASSGASPSRRWRASWPRPTRRRPRTCASSSCGRRSRRCSTAARRRTPPTKQVVALLQAWHDAGGSRRDADRDGKIDDPGVPILDAAWKGLTDAGLCDRLGTALCKQLEGRNARFDQPPGGQYGGWHQYMWKDLRALLGQKVAGAYHLRYCGDGSVKTCSRELWAALDAARKRLAAQQGADPTAWRAPEAKEQITFAPLPLITMQYTNKPTGIHQVMQFGP